MATWQMIDGDKVLLRRTKIAGRDNVQDLPEKKPAKAKAAKAKVAKAVSKTDEVES